MKKYLQVFLSFVRTNLIANMEFRLSFLAFIVMNIFWFFLNIIGVNLIFGQVQSVGGWTKNEMLLLVTVRAMFNSVLWTAVFPNLTRFHELIQKGQLDFVLTKPIGSRFWVSTRYFDFDHLIRIFIAAFFINYYLGLIGHQATWLDISNFLVFFLAGVIIFYNFCFTITTLNIWLVNVFNMENLFDSIQNVGQYPVTIFQGGLKIAMVFLIPTIFISFFPTLALLGKTDWSMWFLVAAFLTVTSVGSQWFWNFALRHYSSASS